MIEGVLKTEGHPLPPEFAQVHHECGHQTGVIVQWHIVESCLQVNHTDILVSPEPAAYLPGVVEARF